MRSTIVFLLVVALATHCSGGNFLRWEGQDEEMLLAKEDTSSSSADSAIFYLSYEGGGTSTGSATAINNLDIISLATASIQQSNVLQTSSIHPRALSLRSMVLVDSLLYVTSARTSQSRLLVSDPWGQDPAGVVWDAVVDYDSYLQHPYGIACTGPYDPSGNLFSKREAPKKNIERATSRSTSNIYRRFFLSNQNSSSVTWYDIEVSSSHVYRNGLVSNSSLIDDPRGLAYDASSTRIFVASKINNQIVSFDVSQFDSLVPDDPSQQLNPIIWVSGIKAPTFIYIDAAMRRLYCGSDNTASPAVFAFLLDSAEHVQTYQIPGESVHDLAGPSGISSYNGTLYVASRMTKAIYMFDINTGDYLGIFIDNLPDVPEALYLVPPEKIVAPVERPAITIALIVAVVVVGILLVIGIAAGLAGLWRFWRSEQDQKHFAYQVVDWDGE